jgi:hypothetical protein
MTRKWTLAKASMLRLGELLITQNQNNAQQHLHPQAPIIQDGETVQTASASSEPAY